jgi:hypothetical protein
MKTESAIRETFDRLVTLRDEAPRGSAARNVLNQRIITLAWVLERSEVPSLMMSRNTLELLACLS